MRRSWDEERRQNEREEGGGGLDIDDLRFEKDWGGGEMVGG